MRCAPGSTTPRRTPSTKRVPRGSRDRHPQDHHIIEIGIGINTGECVVGNMGSVQRFDYSALGDSVNLACASRASPRPTPSRSSSASRPSVLAPDFASLELDLIAVKGKKEAVRVFALGWGNRRSPRARRSVLCGRRHLRRCSRPIAVSAGTRRVACWRSAARSTCGSTICTDVYQSAHSGHEARPPRPRLGRRVRRDLEMSDRRPRRGPGNGSRGRSRVRLRRLAADREHVEGMRILHILDHSPPVQSGYVYRSLAILREQVRLAGRSSRSPPQSIRTASEAQGDHRRLGVHPHTRPAQIPMDAANRIRNTPWFAPPSDASEEIAREWRPSVLHAHSPVANAWAALAVGRRLGLPVVYEIPGALGRRCVQPRDDDARQPPVRDGATSRDARGPACRCARHHLQVGLYDDLSRRRRLPEAHVHRAQRGRCRKVGP